MLGFLLLPLGVVSISTQPALKESTCFDYKCNDGHLAMADGTCIQFQDFTFYVEPCPAFSNKWYCDPITTPGTSNCTEYQIENYLYSAYPNEPCFYDNNCIPDLLCLNSTCQGKTESQACTSSGQCAQGLYCDNGFCISQIKEDRSGCVTDYDCANNLGCNYGVCLPYFSLDVDQSVETCTDDTSLLCKYWGCHNNVCLGKLTSARSYPIECAHDDDCASDKVNGQVFYSECECGYNSESKSYCSLFPNDGPASSYQDALKDYIKGTAIYNCNTERRFERECYKYHYRMHYSDILNYHKTKYELYPQIQDNDDCVREVYTINYQWALENYDQDDSAIARTSALALAVLSLIY
mmetsp:Transcript_34559/g.60674  ORF Transcript_34559/g.60674 Transcript_34559/m.60674 type:complete len:352 (-) Transcript_34559:20-1075(-)